MLIDYRLDRFNNITDVSGGWNDFAQANAAPDCVGELVVGTPLKMHVADEDTWRLLMDLYTRARTGSSVALDYRCDSPDAKRFMRMHVLPEADEALLIRHEVLRVEEQARPTTILRGEGPGEPMLQCSLCCSVLIDQKWQDPFNVATGRFFVVTSTVCPGCRDAAASIEWPAEEPAQA